jgi:hypothetical protein
MAKVIFVVRKKSVSKRKQWKSINYSTIKNIIKDFSRKMTEIFFTTNQPFSLYNRVS